MCNRAYLTLYPQATETADAIAQLVEGGAHIIGKTKFSSFLSREEPSESIDFQTPWNPRADGYQTPGGSSSGSAVAVAAYDWIDIGIGTDTNGSIRRPAQCNGIFGLRPSQGVFSQNGMFTVFKYFDVPGIFARDIRRLALFAETWYGDRLRSDSTPPECHPRILFPRDLVSAKKSPQHSIVLDFVKDLEVFFGIKSEETGIDELWVTNSPKEADGASLHEFLEKVGKDAFLYASYHSATSFRDSYRDQFGKAPIVSPFVQWRWEVGSTVTEEEHKESMRRIGIYKRWFLEEVMHVGSKDTFVFMQSEDVTPKYRDDPPP